MQPENKIAPISILASSFDPFGFRGCDSRNDLRAREYTKAHRAVPLLMSLFFFAHVSNAVWAEQCARCRANTHCTKCSRVIIENKEVKITCWGIRQEDFAIGGPSCPKCQCTTEACKCSPDSKVQSGSKKFTWKIWEPSLTAFWFTKNKLMKRTETKTIPTYKWVVEDLCDQCRNQTTETSTKPEPESKSK